MHSFDLFHDHHDDSPRPDDWKPDDWKPDSLRLGSIDSGAVTPRAVALARRAMHDEGRVGEPLRLLLERFADDDETTAFAVARAYDELTHHHAFRAWLEAVGVEAAGCGGRHGAETGNSADTPSAILLDNLFAELRTRHVYRAAAQEVKEPVLRAILERAARDEAAHARMFLRCAGARLRRRPDELASVLRALHAHTSDVARPRPSPVHHGGLMLLPETTPPPGTQPAVTAAAGVEAAVRAECAGLRPLMERAARDGEFGPLDTSVRRAFSGLTGLDLGSSDRIRRALENVA